MNFVNRSGKKSAKLIYSKHLAFQSFYWEKTERTLINLIDVELDEKTKKWRKLFRKSKSTNVFSGSFNLSVSKSKLADILSMKFAFDKKFDEQNRRCVYRDKLLWRSNDACKFYDIWYFEAFLAQKWNCRPEI